MVKVLKFNEFSRIYEAGQDMTVSEPVGLAVLGAPAGGKSYTIDKIKDVADDARLTRALGKGVVLTVDKLRDDFLSKNGSDQLEGFLYSFYLMKQKAKENPAEYEKWFGDISKLWSEKFSKLLPELEISVKDGDVYFGETVSLDNIKALKDLSNEKKQSAIDKLDKYHDYKRVVRYFQSIKQDDAIKKTLDVSYDEAGDEPSKIVNNMKTLHDKGYVTDVFLIHPSNVASNLVQNFFRVVTGKDGGRDSSGSILQAFKDIESKKDIYTKNAEKVVSTTSKNLERTKEELQKANVRDDKTRGDKPIDVLAEIEPMAPAEGYKTFTAKLNPEQQDIYSALLKYAALSMEDLPEDAKKTLLDLTKDMENKEALEVLKKAEKSGKYNFKYGGVTPELVSKAQTVLK